MPIHVLRGDEAIRSALRRTLSAGAAIATTPVTTAEIFAGMRPSEEAGVRILLGSLDCLRVDRIVGETAGRMLARFRSSHGLELADALVAAYAVVHDYSLWTMNRRDYPMREIRFFAPR